MYKRLIINNNIYKLLRTGIMVHGRELLVAKDNHRNYLFDKETGVELDSFKFHESYESSVKRLQIITKEQLEKRIEKALEKQF